MARREQRSLPVPDGAGRDDFGWGVDGRINNQIFKEDKMSKINHGLIFRFDGLEAADHRIELYSLGESLQGLSRIFTASANFSNTYKISQHRSPDDIIIYAKETKANCFTITTVLDFLQQHQILSGSLSSIISAVSSYILQKNANRKTEELMDRINEIEKLINDSGIKDKKILSTIMQKIEKMPRKYRKAAQQAIAPLGQYASELKITTHDGQNEINLDIQDAIQIRRMDDEIVTELKEITIYISELDKKRRTAKIYIEGEDPNVRFSTNIFDPYILKRKNIYIDALGSDESIKVNAQQLIKANKIKKVFIYSSKI